MSKWKANGNGTQLKQSERYILQRLLHLVEKEKVNQEESEHLHRRRMTSADKRREERKRVLDDAFAELYGEDNR